MVVQTLSAAASVALGERLAIFLRAGDTLLLEGGLGAGKTALTRGIAAGLGVLEPVQSPTFTLLMEHPAGAWPEASRKLFAELDLPLPPPLALAHFDAYRLQDEEGWYELGFDEYPLAGEVAVIEWPERVRAALPPQALRLALSLVPENDEARCFRFLETERWAPERRALLARLMAPWLQD